MKKLMLGLVGATALVACGVESSNVVGYQSTALNYESATMKDVYNMIAVPFVGVDGGNVPVSALKFTNVVKGDFAADCDFLQIWDGNGGYNDFYCYADDGEWYNAADDVTLLSDQYSDGIPAGTAMWYLAWVSETRGAPSFTVSGAIASEADITFTLNSTSGTMKDVYNMLSNPYPTAWLPNVPEQCEITNVIKGDFAADCDFLQIWDGNGGYNDFYCYADDGEWYNAADDVTLISEQYPGGIPAGTAMWYLAWVSDARGGDLKITFKNPVK